MWERAIAFDKIGGQSSLLQNPNPLYERPPGRDFRAALRAYGILFTLTPLTLPYP
ncbi:MAG: hypothetical protein WCK19_01945 [Chloroflexota bacterium]